MPLIPNTYLSNAKLEPVYDADLARERAVAIKASQTIARGTILGEIAGTNAVQTVTLGGAFAAGDTVAYTFGGQSTAALAYNASAATIQAASQALSTIGAGNCLVTGLAGGPYTFTFVGALGYQVVGAITTTPVSVSTTGTATVVQTTAGATLGPGVFAAYASGHSDGTQTPKCILRYDVITDSNGIITLGTTSANASPLADGNPLTTVPVFVSGVFKTIDLTGLDSTAVTDLLMRFESGNLTNGGIVRF
jgi:hypothetical protein